MRLATQAVARAVARIAEAAEADLPDDIQVERTGDGVRLAGRNLRRRWLADVRLRGLSVAGRLP